MDEEAPDGRSDQPFDPSLFRELYHSVNDAIFVHDARTGEILDVNETACEMYGYSRDEMRTLTIEDLSSGEPPYTQETAGEHVEKAAAGDPQRFDWRARDSDGDLFWVEVSMQGATIGDRQLILVIARDTTDRKEMEAEIRRRERRFRAMFESHSAPMLLIEPDTGAIRNANAAASEFYGYAIDELTGITIQEINQLSPEEVATERERARREDRNHFVFEHERADGEVRTVEVHSSPIDLADDSLLFSVVHDVTDRAERERQLQTIDRVLRHNLRNDLNVVRGHAETIIRDGLPAAGSPAERIVEKTNAVLAMAEKERTITTVLNERPAPIPFDLCRTLRTAVRTVEAAFPAATIGIDCPADLRARAIPEIETAFAELVENAISHTDAAEPAVRVTVERRPSTVAVAVADDGPGIPEMERAILAGRQDATPLSHSRGLGLWLVSVIVTQSDGTLSFDDAAEGGSVVTVELPREDGA
jgi:PAS domain S-box-containing protein